MKMLKLACYMLMIVVALAGCSLRPVYGGNARALPVKLTAVTSNSQAPDKIDFTMKQALEQAINPLGESVHSTHTLSVTVEKRMWTFATKRNRVNTRGSTTIIARFTLTNHLGETILSEKIDASDTFEVTSSPYSALVSEEETGALLCRVIANDIALRVASVLHK